MGWSEKLICDTRGSSASVGSSGFARSTASLRSAIASSIFAFAENSAVICETPSLEKEEILLMFSTFAIESSIFAVTNFSISSAEAPGSTVVTMPIGISTSGADSFGIAIIDTRPATIAEPIRR